MANRELSKIERIMKDFSQDISSEGGSNKVIVVYDSIGEETGELEVFDGETKLEVKQFYSNRPTFYIEIPKGKEINFKYHNVAAVMDLMMNGVNIPAVYSDSLTQFNYTFNIETALLEIGDFHAE